MVNSSWILVHKMAVFNTYEQSRKMNKECASVNGSTPTDKKNQLAADRHVARVASINHIKNQGHSSQHLPPRLLL